jgi:putative oxidoreductase
MTFAKWDRMAAFIGRVLMGSFFLAAAIPKILNFADVAARMDAAGLSPSAVLLPLTIALEFGGGLLLILGRRFAVPAALALAGFTLLTNVYFHRFWELSGEMGRLEFSLFFKNVTIAAGLLMAAGVLNQKASAKRDA